MCGRTACTLSKDQICKACKYTGADGKDVLPDWVDTPDDQQYEPRYNMAPASYSPVLLHKSRVGASDKGERAVRPMMWGLIPAWHKGENPTSHGLSTNNCRVESLHEKKRTFMRPLQQGNRCVVLAEGYYEWNTSKAGKQPYLVYFPQPKGVVLGYNIKKEEDEDDEVQPRLITMAGIYDVWKPTLGGDPVWNYSVVTVPASSNLSWMHSRMPAVLNNEEEIQAWLDPESVNIQDAIELLQPSQNLVWHPVSTVVNNSRNNVPECVNEIDLSKPSPQKNKHGSSKLMAAWLNKAKPKQEVKEEPEEETDAKKFKPSS